MALKLMYITNDPKIAEIAESSGVDWIFVDLEINGKEERQGHLDTVISRHHLDDVKRVKSVLVTSKLLVRVNPIFEGSKSEIDRVIDDGADIVMLPFFKKKEEVESFVKIVDARVETMLLLETPEAVDGINDILTLAGIDYIHIGLNDLHLGYGMKFMFELLADGTVEKICNAIKDADITYGFGGIAQIGEGLLPAENIVTEHYRLGSTMVILSRSFCNLNRYKNNEIIKNTFQSGVKAIRDYEEYLAKKENKFYENNRLIVSKKVTEIKELII